MEQLDRDGDIDDQFWVSVGAGYRSQKSRSEPLSTEDRRGDCLLNRMVGAGLRDLANAPLDFGQQG